MVPASSGKVTSGKKTRYTLTIGLLGFIHFPTGKVESRVCLRQTHSDTRYKGKDEGA